MRSIFEMPSDDMPSNVSEGAIPYTRRDFDGGWTSITYQSLCDTD